MTHRAHRIPPTLPARRGMLAPWYRGRSHVDAPHDGPPAADATPAPPAPDDGAAIPHPGPAEAPPVARAVAGGGAGLAAVPRRPPFGRPAF